MPTQAPAKAGAFLFPHTMVCGFFVVIYSERMKEKPPKRAAVVLLGQVGVNRIEEVSFCLQLGVGGEFGE